MSEIDARLLHIERPTEPPITQNVEHQTVGLISHVCLLSPLAGFGSLLFDEMQLSIDIEVGQMSVLLHYTPVSRPCRDFRRKSPWIFA